ncbi:MAG: hypothetical protein HY738_03915 [Bacteroidia bacterium]|nr:hypothetical protein [Bacteroidia bacterium]
MRKELGKYFIDISKLIFAGVVLSTILKVEDFSKIIILLVGLIITIILATIGFIFLKNNK